MRLKVKSFKTIHPVPGLSVGTYWVGKSDISQIEIVEHGIMVHRERGGVQTHLPSVFTWATVLWYEAEILEEEPNKKPSKKKLPEAE